MHQPRLADLFEEFTANTSSSSSTNSSSPIAAINPQSQPPNNSISSSILNGNPAAAHNTPIPHEDILIPPHLQPPNPEDEDDVVPDQHAAFGITRALSAPRRGAGRAGVAGPGRGGLGATGGQVDRSGVSASGPTWRDFESLTEIVRGTDLNDDAGVNGTPGAAGARSGGAGGTSGLAGSTRVTNLR